MLLHELSRDEGILTLTPKGPLQAADFDKLARELDPYLENGGTLRGVLVHGRWFQGWEGFDALRAHFRFVREHHGYVPRVAVVADRDYPRAVARVLAQVADVDVREFAYDERERALAWLRE